MIRAARMMALVVAAAAFACRGGAESPATTTTSGGGVAAEKAAPAAPAPPTGGPGTAVVGSPMPAYSASLLDGSRFDVANEKGNVVLMNLWATWCGPCRYEIPELQKMHDEYAPRGFKVVGVSVDEGDPDEVRKFVADKKMTYPVALDPEGRLAVVMEASVLPTSMLIDREGKVVWKKIGIVSTSDAELNAALQKALGG